MYSEINSSTYLYAHKIFVAYFSNNKLMIKKNRKLCTCALLNVEHLFINIIIYIINSKDKKSVQCKTDTFSLV